MKYFKVTDECHSFHDGELFLSKKDVIENLASYHNTDWTDEKYKTIEEWLKGMTEGEKLDELLEWGQWELQEVDGIRCPLCEVPVEHKEHNGTHLWPCTECNFVGFEYETNNNCADVVNYLNKSNA